MKHILYCGALVLALLSTPVFADEFTETIDLALEAYEDGDIAGAKDELAYATQLLQEMVGADFQQFLPNAMSGWTREIDESSGSAGALAAFGGGTVVIANYSNGNDDIKFTMMANNALVASMSAMLGNPATMGAFGKTVRIKRKNFLVQDSEIQGIIGNVLVQVSGSASTDDKLAYIKELDFKAIGNY